MLGTGASESVHHSSTLVGEGGRMAGFTEASQLGAVHCGRSSVINEKGKPLAYVLV